MFSDWYFCCCINADPERTHAFLSILATFENPESEDQLLYLACEELQRTEIWMQAYALPYLFRLLHREGLSAGVFDVAGAFLENLLEFISDDIRDPFHTLIDLVVSGARPSQLIQQLTDCVQETHLLSPATAAHVPYLDLKEFLPETLLLAVMNDELTHDQGFAVNLSTALEEDAVLQSFLQQALDYEFGRLPFRLANRIAYFAGGYSRDDVLSLMLENAFSTIAFEPDLLQTYAEISFLNSPVVRAEPQDPGLARGIVHESVRLSILRDILRRSHGKSMAPVSRVGLRATGDRKTLLPIIYWQATLWELVADLDAQRVATELQKFWKPPVYNPSQRRFDVPRNLKIVCLPGERSLCEDQFSSLMQLLIPWKTSVLLQTQDVFYLSYKYGWIVSTPWIWHHQYRWYDYPKAKRPEALLRLVAGACVSVKILQQLPSEDPCRRDFCALIAHAASVLYQYRLWLRDYDDPEHLRKGTPKLPLAITGLVLFGRRQIDLAGRGHVPSIHPRDFVEILRHHAAEGVEDPKSERYRFNKENLPQVLMSWIEDAYPGAQDATGPGRWLELIPEVYTFYRQKEHYYFPDRVKAALIGRFLCPEYAFSIDEDLDWRTAEYKGEERQWQVGHRQLLLTERGLPPGEWYRPDWDETQIYPSTLFVRALERLAALGESEARSEARSLDIPQQVEQNWRAEWKGCLNRIEKPMELDRFIRLRLLELLDHPATQTLAAQELILFVLLEYGSLYDLRDLFERTFPIDQTGSLAEVNEPREQLQQTMVRAMCRVLHQKVTHTDPASQSSAKDPRIRWIDIQNTQLIRDMLLKLNYLAWSAGDEPAARQVVSTLVSSQLRQFYAAHGETALRTEEVAIEESRTGLTRAIPPKDEAHIPDWALRAGIHNLSQRSATLFYEDLDLAGLVNLFDMSPREQQAFTVEHGEPRYVLAVVVQVWGVDGDRLRFVFDCGFPFYITTTRERDPERFFSSGDYVKLPVHQNQKGYWRVPASATLYHVAPQERPGDVVIVRVREYWTQQHMRYLELKRGYRNLYGDVDVRRWDADVSRGFRKFEQPPDLHVLADVGRNGQLTPIDLNLDALLARHLSRHEPNCIVLTLIEACQGPLGAPAWRFSTRPGEIYMLTRDDFTEESAEALELRLDALRNAYGLLLTVEPALRDGQCRLRLVHETPEIEDRDVLWPDLRTPFDERNIEWRDVFSPSSDNETYIAVREGATWYFRPDPAIPGYPAIQIFWDKSPQNRKASRVEFRVTSWNDRDQRTGEVHGEPPWLYKLTVLDQSWEAFIDDWLNIQPQDRLQLKRVVGLINPNSDGFVSCLTQEGALIQVEVESLTMQPVPSQERLKTDVTGRTVEVIWCGWYATDSPPRVDPEQIPPEAIVDQSCLGLLTEVPNQSEGTLCGVAWKTAEGILHGRLQIDNLAELKPVQGSQIRGFKPSGGEWRFTVKTPRIRARALWSIRRSSAYEEGMTYLGEVTYHGEPCPIAEVRPGELVILPETPSGAHHLARYNGVVFERVIPPQWRTDNTARRRPRYQRAILHLGRTLVVGDGQAGAYARDVRVAEIKLSLSDRAASLVMLQRAFDLRAVRSARPQRRQRPEVESRQEVWNSILNDYLENPQNLHGMLAERGGEVGVRLTVLHGEREVKVPVDLERTRWISWVRVPDEEGAYIVEAQYPGEAVVRLFENAEGRIVGSFRRVPSLTPEEFKRDIGVDFDEFVMLEDPLHYVGPEAFDEVTGTAYDEICHRFEMGFGQTLLVPERALRFNGDRFSQLELLLFHGDIVKGVTFLEPEAAGDLDVDAAEEERPTTLINIESVNLQFSQARTLYAQRSDYQIVHILHLVPSGDHLEVRSVEGFDENRVIEKRLFTRIRAELTPESQQRLLSRFQDWNAELGQGPQILGRLDEQRFRETLGRDLMFEHVRLSFEPSDAGAPLMNDELVFLQAENIIPLPNDMALRIGPPNFLADEDVGKDMHSLLLLRRSFSLREALLKQIYDKRGANGLQQELLLVRVRKHQRRGGGEQISTSIVRRAPLRKVSALIGAIERSGLLLAAVAQIESDQAIRLELQPGVFVKVEPENIAYVTEGLRTGDIVRVENCPNTTFRITRAAFSDIRYVPGDTTRAVVALPKNSLLDEDLWETQDVGQAAFWGRTRGFTVGGLPNLTPVPGNYNYRENTWHYPHPEDFIDLMETPHPKPACIGRDTEDIRIAPYTADPVGHLELAKNGLSITCFATFHGRTWDNRMYWNFISFGDEPIRRLVARINRETWYYHDAETGRWTEDDRVEHRRLSAHDVWTGPIFFEKSGRYLHLRYDESNFLRFGFPVSELINALRRRPKNAGTYPVAGISRSPEGGLWLELVPGRLVELPANLVVRQARTSRGFEPLSSMHWENFAPGDRLTLALVSGDSIAVERIALLDWEPGPRNALGPQTFFLPVHSTDQEAGALTIGAGVFTLTLPFEHPNPGVSLVAVDADNFIKNLDSPIAALQQIDRGDVVLLGMSDKGRPVLLGLEVPGLKIRLHARYPFDPEVDLIAEAINPHRGPAFLDWHQLKDVIDAAGGALPLTVEEVSGEERTVYLSSRHQRDAVEIPPGEISRTHVLSLLDERRVLLRCGGGFIRMRMDRVVSGLPKALFPAAVQMMATQRVPVWLHRREGGALSAGLREERGREIFVEIIGAVSSDDASRAGLICRSLESLNLFWLPKAFAAWTDLPIERLEKLLKRRDAFKVRIVGKRKKSDVVSIIALSDVRKELSELEIGKELTVRVLEEVPHGEDCLHQYLVESFAVGVIMGCKLYKGDPLKDGAQLPVEVSRLVTGTPPLVTVVPLGGRPLSLDLPSWMTSQLPEPGHPREPLARYLGWRREDVTAQDLSDAERVREISDEALQRLLCHAYNSLDASEDHTYLQIRAAAEWARRSASQPEINPVYSIMAALLLEKHGSRKKRELTESLNYINDPKDARSLANDWRKMAYQLARDLGKRALRSMHVEILAQEWLLDIDQQTREDGLWRRLQRIKDYLTDPQDAESLGTLRRFCDAVELQHDTHILPIAHSLAAATGYLSDISTLTSKAEITTALIELYKTMPCDDAFYLSRYHIAELTRLLNKIDAGALDITLLRPLPDVDVTTT